MTAAIVGVSLTANAALGQELPPGGTFSDDDGSLHEPMTEAIAMPGSPTDAGRRGTTCTAPIGR